MTVARLGLPASAATCMSAAACARVLGMAAFRSATHVVAYAPADNEIDPDGVVHAARRAGKVVYYPRRANGTLQFLCADRADLQPDARGLLEPYDGEALGVDAASVLFLVPGVAFDPRGARLGRGAGCYDRALAAFGAARRIGFGYDFQVVPLLPEATWDVRMHAVVTDARLLECAA